MHQLPEPLFEAAEQPCGEACKWTAFVKQRRPTDPPRYTWRVDAGRSFGGDDMAQWVNMVIRERGFPVRIQQRTDSGVLVYESTLWGDEEEFSQEAMIPGGFIDDVTPTYVEAVPESPIERAVAMLLDKPEECKNAVIAVVQGFKAATSRDDQAIIDAAVERSAAAAAQAAAAVVEQKLAQLMLDAGYELTPEGDVIDPEGDVIDIPEPPVNGVAASTFEAVEVEEPELATVDA